MNKERLKKMREAREQRAKRGFCSKCRNYGHLAGNCRLGKTGVKPVERHTDGLPIRELPALSSDGRARSDGSGQLSD